MDIGDIIRLIFFGLIFLSFFSGAFQRLLHRLGQGQQETPKKREPRPTELSQTGGSPSAPTPRPARPAATPAPNARPARPVTTPGTQHTLDPARHEQQWEDESFSHPEVHKEEVRERYAAPKVTTYDDAIERGDITRAGSPANTVRASERTLLERDVVDMPPPMDIFPGRRRASSRPRTGRRRHPATGGDVLRGSLKNPETLERAFIVKEVLDPPLGARRRR